MSRLASGAFKRLWKRSTKKKDPLVLTKRTTQYKAKSPIGEITRTDEKVPESILKKTVGVLENPEATE